MRSIRSLLHQLIGCYRPVKGAALAVGHHGGCHEHARAIGQVKVAGAGGEAPRGLAEEASVAIADRRWRYTRPSCRSAGRSTLRWAAHVPTVPAVLRAFRAHHPNRRHCPGKTICLRASSPPPVGPAPRDRTAWFDAGSLFNVTNTIASSACDEQGLISTITVGSRADTRGLPRNAPYRQLAGAGIAPRLKVEVAEIRC